MKFNDLTEEEQKLAIANKYDLLREKAIILKEKGIEACRDNEELNIGDIKVTNDLLDLIEKGVPQIIEYRGLSFQRPFEGLGISGFYFFMHLFHLEMCRQRAYHKKDYTIDEIMFKNTITGDELWLGNKVPPISDEEIEKYKKK